MSFDSIPGHANWNTQVLDYLRKHKRQFLNREKVYIFSVATFFFFKDSLD